ncbi:hypothetical protein AcW1_008239 [Taiwanofungus camphoratus]|nr:hypothetical protein AcV5_008536 [Antrodia cinnamomea]KAI0951115.1 hypothetical protein AcW1_008239 [Antrodia cinnamomea]KAI0956009.1 hypothetical protein AcV7_006525 [Antrodia cinnamomea]
MDEPTETDIGLVNLSRPSTSPPSTRPYGLARTASTGPLRSPSSPSLLPIYPRQLSRSNTSPRIQQTPRHEASLSLDGLSMDPNKVTRLRRWILIDFDLEIGPKIRCVYPPLDLSPSEAENVAFSAFPDCAQFEQGSQVHSFRIRANNPCEDKLLWPSGQRPKTDDGFIYGYSHFTQRRDAASKRGYQQRSLVLLTHLAYPALFYTLITKLGPSFLAHGGPMLEAACHNIATWSEPRPDATLELGFLGSVFHAELPHAVDTQQALPVRSLSRLNDAHDPDSHVLVSLAPPDPPVLSILEACLPHIWSVWECLVLCEPILVFGTSPAVTSQAVWWLRDVIRPIPLAGDFRPFFTIHDADHAALVNSRPPAAGLLLGVTNPFFGRACKHWPHILSLSRDTTKMDNNSAGPLPGWKSRTHKRYVSRDRALLQQLQAACVGSDRAKRDASALLRQHLSSRTSAFLVPLQRYLQTLIPTPAEAAQMLRLKPFSERDFLVSLRGHGTPLPFKSARKAKEFYTRWIRTPAFGVWIAHQEEVVQRVLGRKS